jgi:hypothetical protein
MGGNDDDGGRLRSTTILWGLTDEGGVGDYRVIKKRRMAAKSTASAAIPACRSVVAKS